MDTGGIKELLQIKKKSEASITDKNSFQSEWLSYVCEHGFDKTAEAFLYDGFSFLGIFPFITYLSETDDKQETLNQLLSGKYFYKNRSITFKAMLHLLALLVEKFPDEKPLIMLVISRLPELSVNKAGKRLGDMTKSVDKYFVQVLSPDTVFPNLESLELRPEIKETFCNMMVEILSDIVAEGHSSTEELSTIARIEKWLSDVHRLPVEVEKPEVSTSQTVVMTADAEDVKSNRSNDTADQGVFEKRKKYTWRDGISITTNAIIQLEKELSLSQMNNGNLISENARLKVERDNVQNALNREHDCCEQQRTEISRLSGDISLLRKQISALEIIIRDKDTEIGERIKFADMLSRDITKRSEEAANRLAAKLRVEYRDFLDAESLPMDPDLGENMRIQLKSIFDILKKNGLSLE